MAETAIEKGDRVFHLFQMKIEEVRQGYARVSMPILDIMRNGMGFVHGGVLFSLADIAFGAACNYGEKTGTVTLSSSINYLHPGRKGPITAEASSLRSGRHVVLYNIDVRDADGVLLCHGTFEGFRTDFEFSNLDPKLGG